MTGQEFAPIQQRLMAFVRKRFNPGYNHYSVSKLVGDASARQYYRYVTNTGTSLILAAYPESFDPEKLTFRQVYELLQRIEIPVPEILEIDGELGIVLQEDLGNDSLQRILRDAGDKQRTLLLRNAIDHILTIQSNGTAFFSPECEGYHLAFDEEKLNWEFDFFRKHYLGNYRKLETAHSTELQHEFFEIAGELAAFPRVLCHRDFHVRNMMVKNGILYVIDFQDARWGPVTYDLCSLLKDSIELEISKVDDLIGYYLEGAERLAFLQLRPSLFGPEPFRRQFHLMCIQRLLKALGTYAYQIIVRENFIYEQYMAGSLHRALLSLQALAGFPHAQRLVESELDARSRRR